jgi:hypothetical protein
MNSQDLKVLLTQEKSAQSSYVLCENFDLSSSRREGHPSYNSDIRPLPDTTVQHGADIASDYSIGESPAPSLKCAPRGVLETNGKTSLVVVLRSESM